MDKFYVIASVIKLLVLSGLLITDIIFQRSTGLVIVHASLLAIVLTLYIYRVIKQN